MADPIHTAAPDDSGSKTVERFEYQDHAALRPILQMLAGGPVLHVTCEHIEDIVVAFAAPSGEYEPLWDFQQIKTREAVEPWTLTDVLASGPLKSLWRTHGTVKNSGLMYRLTAGLEGYIDPADAGVNALRNGEGGRNESCLERVMRHLKANDRDSVIEFLTLVRVQELPRRGDIELRNVAVLSELGPELSGAEVRALYDQLARTTSLAMQGRTGPRWPLLITEPEPSDRVLRKRITLADLSAVRQRLIRPDHVLLREVTRELTALETALVRKLRAGGASLETIEDAQTLRAHADSHRLSEQALGIWPDDPAVEGDLDQRLLFVARRVVSRLKDHRPSPADAIFDDLQTRLNDKPETYDRKPLYARDGMLLTGRACALSDQCHFAWGRTDD